jgi:hypothetical protein
MKIILCENFSNVNAILAPFIRISSLILGYTVLEHCTYCIGLMLSCILVLCTCTVVFPSKLNYFSSRIAIEGQLLNFWLWLAADEFARVESRHWSSPDMCSWSIYLRSLISAKILYKRHSIVYDTHNKIIIIKKSNSEWDKSSEAQSGLLDERYVLGVL